MIRTTLLLFIVFLLTSSAIAADTLTVRSPSGRISVELWLAKQLTYRIKWNGAVILNPSAIDLLLSDGRSLGDGAIIRRSTTKNVRDTIVSPVPEKRKLIPDRYNTLELAFRKPFRVVFRVYDDGVAYRISTAFKDSITVKDETAEFNFPGEPSAYFPEIPYRDSADLFQTSFEDLYQFKKISEFPEKSIAYSPLLIVPAANPKMAITESDLDDYPGMFFKGTSGAGLKAVFARYPAEEKTAWALYSQKQVARRADYIARTSGTRNFPWRVLMIAEHDRELPGNDLVYRLAAPSTMKDVSWVQPGTITDEWIIDLNLFNVPFRAGRNTASYKYYIDFAKRFGYDRIMMDAGWSDNNDLLKVVPEINMDTLLSYAKEKGVKIALWTLALTLDRQLDSALIQFEKWGIDFIMTDFIDRDDQLAVNFHRRIAKACADHKIMIMFHGTYPPKGLNRTYPNAVTREAVLGSEYNIWSSKVSPAHDALLPYTRMLAGSMDYEPGMLNNATQKGFRPVEGYVMSPGTRAHQAAMLIVYDNPMQFFAGNPSQGWKEPAYMEFIGGIPTTWDETNIIDGEVGKFIVTARKKHDAWYIGGLSDWSARDLELSFDFLDADSRYAASICSDGINADRYASDYLLENYSVTRDTKRTIHLAPGGGFLIRIVKK